MENWNNLWVAPVRVVGWEFQGSAGLSLFGGFDDGLEENRKAKMRFPCNTVVHLEKNGMTKMNGPSDTAVRALEKLRNH